MRTISLHPRFSLARGHVRRGLVSGLAVATILLATHLQAHIFTSETVYPVGDSPSSILEAPLNDDPFTDLAVANAGDDTVSVLLGNGDGTFAEAVNYPVGDNPLWLEWDDFNEDFAPDLVTANGDGTLTVLLNQLDGTFLPAP